MRSSKYSYIIYQIIFFHLFVIEGWVSMEPNKSLSTQTGCQLSNLEPKNTKKTICRISIFCEKKIFGLQLFFHYLFQRRQWDKYFQSCLFKMSNTFEAGVSYFPFYPFLFLNIFQRYLSSLLLWRTHSISWLHKQLHQHENRRLENNVESKMKDFLNKL